MVILEILRQYLLLFIVALVYILHDISIEHFLIQNVYSYYIKNSETRRNDTSIKGFCK